MQRCEGVPGRLFARGAGLSINRAPRDWLVKCNIQGRENVAIVSGLWPVGWGSAAGRCVTEEWAMACFRPTAGPR